MTPQLQLIILAVFTAFAVFTKVTSPKPITIWRAIAEILACIAIGLILVGMFAMGVGDL